MDSETDEFTGITWYSDKSSPTYANVNSFHLYIGKKGNEVWMNLVIQYAASKWLFIDEYSILVDGNLYNYKADYFDVERDHSGGLIWEWYVIEVGNEEIEMLEEIINSDRAVIRHYGRQYYDDRTITDGEKQALVHVLATFEAMGGRLDQP
jgi:hypothetical protein